jgi:PAS domain S-box-containing protein
MSISTAEAVRLIPDHILDKWQSIVDTMAEMIGVSYAIISRIDPPNYEIFRINRSNPKQIGPGACFNLFDTYCESVFKSRTKLIISNALEDEKWQNHPEVSAGLISYLGYPIILPNGEVFGTICVLDIKENAYGHKIEKLISLYKDQIESHLTLLFHQADLENEVRRRTFELSRTNAQLQIEVDERKKAYGMLEESEERFRCLVENAPIGIVIDMAGKFLYRNPELIRIIGPLPDGVGFPYFDNLYRDDLNRIKTVYQEFLEKESGIFDAVFRIHPFDSNRKSNNIKWIKCRAIRINYERNRAIIAALVDITREKEMEQIARVEDKMSAIGRVTTGIAHEILNPLSAINMNVNTLKEVFEGSATTEEQMVRTTANILNQIQDASICIEKIVRNVTDFARPSPGSFEQADLNQCVQKALNLCSPMLRKNRISIETSLSHELPFCQADTQMIQEVLLNLINNSVEVMQRVDGQRRLTISSRLRDGAANIHLADTGPGIPDEIRDKIFDPFFSTKKKGLGIGLTLAQRIVRNHGGDLRLLRSDRSGAEFAIILPTSAT